MEPWLVTICTMAAGRGELGGSSWGRRRRPATRPLWSPAPRLPPPPGCLGLLRKHGREVVWAGVAGGGQSGSRIPSSRAGGADWPATEFSAEGQLVRLWLISAVISLSVRVHSNAAGAPLQRRTGRHRRFSGENIGAVQGAGATGARRRANTVWKLAKQLKPI